MNTTGADRSNLERPGVFGLRGVSVSGHRGHPWQACYSHRTWRERRDTDMDKVKRESPVGVVASWTALVASFGLSFATWVSLAVLAGFDQEVSAFGYTVALAWLMPLAVDGYVVTALVAWMAPVSDEVARFAKWNTYAAAGIGVVAQSSYHALSVDTSGGQEWRAVLAGTVGALPPLASALSVHLRALVRRAGHVQPDTDMDKPEPVRPDIPRYTRTPDTADTDSPVDMADAGHLDSPDTDSPDTAMDTDTLYLPDTWTADAPVSPAPVSVPAPCRTVRTDTDLTAWKLHARELITGHPDYTDATVAAAILVDAPDTWSTLEAGRKAVSRLRKAL